MVLLKRESRLDNLCEKVGLYVRGRELHVKDLCSLLHNNGE